MYVDKWSDFTHCASVHVSVSGAASWVSFDMRYLSSGVVSSSVVPVPSMHANDSGAFLLSKCRKPRDPQQHQHPTTQLPSVCNSLCTVALGSSIRCAERCAGHHGCAN